MKGFISMNPGLRSRFQTFVAFPNYSPDEMSEIFVRMGQQHEIGVSQVLPIVRTVFEKTNTGGEAGNGRFVRSLFEQMYANLAVRAAADGQVEAHEITEFEPQDVPDLPTESQKPRIGFV
jgi:stage V sporulation protein K